MGWLMRFLGNFLGLEGYCDDGYPHNWGPWETWGSAHQVHRCKRCGAWQETKRIF